MDQNAPAKVDKEGSSTNPNHQNQLWQKDQGPSFAAVPDGDNVNDGAAPTLLAGKINDFDLSKVDGDDGPSDSEQQYNRNSISNSPTRNRKPIQNSQPKTNL